MVSDQFRFPSLFGKGLRLVATGKFDLWKKRLMAEVLYGLTRFFDRHTQGNGMQQIRSPWKNDITLQLGLRI